MRKVFFTPHFQKQLEQFGINVQKISASREVPNSTKKGKMTGKKNKLLKIFS